MVSCMNDSYFFRFSNIFIRIFSWLFGIFERHPAPKAKKFRILSECSLRLKRCKRFFDFHSESSSWTLGEGEFIDELLSDMKESSSTFSHIDSVVLFLVVTNGCNIFRVLRILSCSSIVDFEGNLEESSWSFFRMNKARINVPLRAPMFYSIVDEFIGDEDKSPSPERMNIVCVKYFPHKVTNYLGLTMINREINATIHFVNISKGGENFLKGFRISEMCDIDFNHEDSEFVEIRVSLYTFSRKNTKKSIKNPEEHSSG